MLPDYCDIGLTKAKVGPLTPEPGAEEEPEGKDQGKAEPSCCHSKQRPTENQQYQQRQLLTLHKPPHG